MKTIYKVMLSILAFGLFIFNISISKNTSERKGDFSLNNIKVLKASATEYNCDKSNSNSCTTPSRTSTGVLTVYF
jgi:hypothetical protein